MVKHKEEGKEFNKQDYYKNPQNYVGNFKQYLSKINFLLNCIYWETKYPRVITESDLEESIKEGTCKL
jgi:saccharopine dehydrogenase (NAD+, L-lysine-forming)